MPHIQQKPRPVPSPEGMIQKSFEFAQTLTRFIHERDAADKEEKPKEDPLVEYFLNTAMPLIISLSRRGLIACTLEIPYQKSEHGDKDRYLENVVGRITKILPATSFKILSTRLYISNKEEGIGDVQIGISWK